MNLATIALALQGHAPEPAAEEGGGMSTILPETAELVYGVLAFALLFWLLNKFAFPKMNLALAERATSIQGKLEESETRLTQAEEIRRKYEAQLGDARSEAGRIIDEAKQTAEALRRELVTRAETEAQALVTRAQGEVQAERDRAVQSLRQEVGALSVQLAGKIVEKELDQRQHEALVDSYIQQLTQNPQQN